MRIIITFILLFHFLFGVSVKEISGTTPFEKLDFNNSLYIVPADYIHYVFQHGNIRIVGIDGIEKGVILTHKKRLTDIKSVANANLAANIVLKAVNKKYKTVKATLNDFLNNKVDAIYLSGKISKSTQDLYIFHINRFIFFPKKIIIGDKNYLQKHKGELYIFKENLDILFNALILSKYYYHNFSPMSNIVYFKNPHSKLLKVYVTPNWPPFDIYLDGKLTGIGIEFWKLIAKKAHVDYVFVKDSDWSDILNKIKTQQADITPNTSATEERKKFAYFSKTYVSFPLGIVCKNSEHFQNIDEIESIAVGKNFTAEKLMKKHYPNIKYIESKNTLDALYKVQNSQAQCAVDILPALMWNINQNSIQDLVLEFKTPFKFDLKVMISKKDKDLLNKINHAIETLTDKEKSSIISKYSSVILVEKNVKSLNIWIILFFIVILAAIVIILLKFKKRSEIDEMTKILNRATIEREFKDLLKKSGGGILFLDLDNFKTINDTYGHEKGDYVLKEFSNLIRSNIRNSDLFGRWGGEEFVLVLPKTDYENALKKAESIRKKIEEYNFDALPITVSIGVTDFKKGENMEEVIKRADEGVYKAKRGGRNRVIGKKRTKD